MSVIKKYFGTDGIRGCYGKEPITTDFMKKIASVLSDNLSYREKRHVVIGTDTRESAESLEAGLRAGFLAKGIGVYSVGVLPTPAIAFATQHYQAAMGIVISASHNPYQDNGIKFFNDKGFKFDEQQEQTIEIQLDEFEDGKTEKQTGAECLRKDVRDNYTQHCFNQFADPINLQNMKIVVDCAHGAACSLANRVFSPIHCDLTLINDRPDGQNINQHCGSTNPEQLQHAVRTSGAEVGIAFDGDADRVILVDSAGQIIDGDQILYILANFLQDTGRLAGGVVGTQMSNLGLEVALKKRSIPFARSQVGDRYVMEMLHQQGWFLGGEASGHVLNLVMSTTGDGLLTALQLLHIMQQTQKPIADLASGMEKYPQMLINVPVSNKQLILTHPSIKKAVNNAETTLGSTGRVLLRPSGTESLIRVMVEGEAMGAIETVAEQLAREVEVLAHA